MTIEERKQRILDKIAQMQAEGQDMQAALEILEVKPDEEVEYRRKEAAGGDSGGSGRGSGYTSHGRSLCPAAARTDEKGADGGYPCYPCEIRGGDCMIVTSKIKLDMAQPGTANPVFVVQGDGNTRAVDADLLANGSSWAPDDGWEAAITYRKPDGTKGLYNLLEDGSSAINISGSTATVILAQQMMTVPGAVRAAIVFNNQRLDQLTSFPFLVSVARNQFAGAQQSEDYIRLQWLEDKLEEYLRKAADSGAFDGAPGRDGVDGKDGAPGADGHTPEYGVDYGTPEQIAGIAQKAAALIDFDANQLKDDKLDKPETPPDAAGKVLRVLAVNEDGTFTCEWADAPSGGVSDVQINGSSIVTDGAADIPIGLAQLGAVRVNDTSSGRKIYIDRYTGVLGVGTAFPSSIDSRNGVLGVIDPGNIDYAVKAAMCDGKGAAWTDAERIAALLRMGCTVDDNGFVKWGASE